MIILAVDSSTPVQGVAIVDEKKNKEENFLNTGLTHSEQLLPAINQTLKQAKITLANIEAFALTQGPGSFTGLRIGIATIKGLAQVSGKKIVAIPTLDALAYNLWGYEGIICPILNARRNEVYTALYEMQAEEVVRISDYQAVNPEELAEILLKKEKPVTFLGDGVLVYKDLFAEKLSSKACWAPLHNLMVRASSVGILALQKLAQGIFDDLFTLEPMYIRRSEAEVKLEARQCQR